MSKRKTHEEFVQELAEVNPDIEVLGVYKNSKTKLLVKCKIDQYEWETIPSNLLRPRGCPMCGGSINKTHDEFLEEVAIANKNIKILGIYKNANTKILTECIIHNYKQEMFPTSILKGCGCIQCRSERIHIAQSKTHEDYKAECLLLGFEPIEKYYNSKTPIKHKCLICNTEFLAQPNNILNGHTGCYKCRQSATSYERCVMDILDKYNYGNKFQWSQKVYDNNRRYDFYLPEYNIAIEVDGEQHYKPVCFNGISQEKAEINYIEQQRIDAEKTRWCIENNIKLIRIPYYWSAEETEEYILNYLKEADYYGKEES